MRFLSSLPVIRNPSSIPSVLLPSVVRFHPRIHLESISRSPDLSPLPFLERFRSIRGLNLHFPFQRDFSANAVESSSCTSCFSGGEVAPMVVGTVAAAQEGSVAWRFWIKSQKEALLASYTPFVVCLASGRLELETFRHYIGQDVHFLRAFAHAYELAEDYADDDDAKAAICDLRKAVLEELKMHGAIVAEWGVDPTKEIIPNAATVKYTDFLLATAAGKVEGEKGPGKIATPFEKTKIATYTIGAMVPWMRLYAFLGKELQKFAQYDEGSHPYEKWIANYSSTNFEAAALQIEELLDKLSVSLTGEELEVVEKLYYQAMKLEFEFFSAQPTNQWSVVPLTRLHAPSGKRFFIFSDFDLTCTVVDSSAILAEIAILTAPKVDHSTHDDIMSRKSSADLRKTWDALSSLYTEGYEQCIESILPTDAKDFDYKVLYKALEKLSEFEKEANSRVIDSGVLRGLNLEDITRAGERLIHQYGCLNFFRNISKKEELNVELHVLSYCWCGDLIRSSFLSGDLDMKIYSNELCYEDSISTGEIIKLIESPIDKVRLFKDILKKSSEDGNHLSVYIGDSVGDLLCLLEADVGIVIGSSASLRKLGTQYGVSFVPLLSGLVKKQRQLVEGEPCTWKGLSGVLYTVSSWAEVQAFILGA